MKNKIKYQIFTIILTLMSIISVIPEMAQAAGVTIYSYNVGAYNSYPITTPHKSNTSEVSAVGTVFNATNTGYLTTVNFYLYRSTGTTGVIKAKLEGVTGTIAGRDAQPNGTLLDTSSNSINAIDISNSGGTWQTFTFQGGVQLEANQCYAIYLYMESETGDLRIVPYYTTTAQPTQTRFDYLNGNWYNPHNYALRITVLGQTEAPPGATPTPTATAGATPTGGNWIDNDYGATNSGITFLTEYMPLFIPLILIMVCGFLGYYFAQGWGFFAGLNVGFILCVTFQYLDIWTMVILAVVDIVFVYGMRRGQ